MNQFRALLLTLGILGSAHAIAGTNPPPPPTGENPTFPKVAQSHSASGVLNMEPSGQIRSNFYQFKYDSTEPTPLGSTTCEERACEATGDYEQGLELDQADFPTNTATNDINIDSWLSCAWYSLFGIGQGNYDQIYITRSNCSIRIANNTKIRTLRLRNNAQATFSGQGYWIEDLDMDDARLRVSALSQLNIKVTLVARNATINTDNPSSALTFVIYNSQNTGSEPFYLVNTLANALVYVEGAALIQNSTLSGAVHTNRLSITQNGVLIDETSSEPSLILDSPSTGNCLGSHPITIRAYDAQGDLDIDYTGTVSLTVNETPSGTVTWSTQGAQGVLTPNEPNATYRFVAGDSGAAPLAFTYDKKGTVNISATASGMSGASKSIDFQATSLQFTPKTTSPHSANTDVTIEVSVLEQGECTVETAIVGSQTLSAQFDYVSENKSIPVSQLTIAGEQKPANSAKQLNLTFSSGKSEFIINYPDAGSISLSGSLTSNNYEYIGSSSLYWRPHALYISRVYDQQSTNNPGGTASSGNAFISAGTDFKVDIEAVTANCAPASGNCTTESYDSTIDPTKMSVGDISFTNIQAVSPSNVDGTLNLSGAVPTFSRGKLTAAVNYSEVGGMTLEAQSQLEFPGITSTVSGASSTIGRFYPDKLTLDAFIPTINACPAFSYLGDEDALTDASLTLKAKNKSDVIVRNYSYLRGYTKQATLKLYLLLGQTDTSNQVERLIPDSSWPNSGIIDNTLWGSGQDDQYVYSGSMGISRKITDGVLGDGPYNQAKLGLLASGGDGEQIEIPGSDDQLVVGGETTRLLGELAVPGGTAAPFWLGRINLQGVRAQRSDIDLKPMVRLEYWDGDSFEINSLDSCTVLADNLMTFNGAAKPASGGSVSLDCADIDGCDPTKTTAISYNLAPGVTRLNTCDGDYAASSTDYGLLLCSPGSLGRVKITLPLTGSSLEYLNQQSGTTSNWIDPPQVEALWGAYNRDNRIMYRKHNY
ncbi:DUF6701 domain-containing protein [Dongshaea marina]|uniref:DUF6701 domain-containing protein n=1 Tax=Dongshaea marina TaxID=2047966 RepID=UPI000D3E651E|nr:DUF6701 domain-containing protein [Dongshaea marina]